MISHFFIDRPIFASSLSFVITLTGAIALWSLPLSQYPRITPPSISISITYPGSSPQMTADAVAAPIEQQVNGIDGMLYMSSQMGTDGTYTLTVTFDVSTDLNKALVMVQNRVALAMPQLPSSVQMQGITIRKRTPDMLLIVNFFSPDGRYNDIYLSNFATIFVRDELLRIDGVSDVGYLGQRDYSIRTWLDPQKLAALNVTATDVANAIRNQNLDAPAGRLGQPPISQGLAFQHTIQTQGRLRTPEEFGDIIIKVGQMRVPAPTALVKAPAKRRTFDLMSALPTKSNIPAQPTSDSIAPSITGNVSSGTTPITSLQGGGTTSGGASSSGGGTTGGGALGTSTSTSSTTETTSAAPVLSAMTGLSITPAAGNAELNGALSSVTMGRGPGRSSASIVRLRDVSRIELGAKNYNQACTFDGHQAVGMSVYQLPGTNALDVGERVKAKLKELKERFPDGLEYGIGSDTTPYVRESVEEVLRTLIEAIILVALVVMLFLQSWRAVIIPLIAVPVSLIGTFAVMAALNFSLNNISLFGLVLAIGIVVDDAIVVVENVERWLDQLDPREATRKAMDEVTGPIIAVALVLCAVFVPCAFIRGITGRFFIQFAVTIAVSTLFSTFNSLTLSPALAAILLRSRHGPSGSRRRRDPVTFLLDITLGWFFWLFNKTFGAGTTAYGWIVGKMLRLNLMVLIGYLGLVVLAYWVFKQAPTGFVPRQDQGRLIVAVQLPDSASLQRHGTKDAVAKIEKITRETPGVYHTTTISGLSFVQQVNSSNFSSMIVVLKPFAERQSPQLRDTAIMAKLRTRWRKEVPEAIVNVFGSSPIPGLSVAGGFKIQIEDRGGVGMEALEKYTNRLIAKMKEREVKPDSEALKRKFGPRHQAVEAAIVATPQAKLLANVQGGKPFVVKCADGPAELEPSDLAVLQKVPELASASTQFRTKTPQLFLDIDRTKAQALGVPLDEINQTLGMYMGSLYINSFNEFGRHWQVTAQVDGKYRNRVENLNLFKVRNQWGQMVPLGTLVKVSEMPGPVMAIRYNLYLAAPITGNLNPGVSSGDAIKAVNKLTAEELPLTMKAEWTELMFVQIRAGNTALYIFALSVAAVFLALAALYESWSLPLAVILVVPLCLLCSVAGVLYAHKDIDIFVQIGLVVLVGLACKNAILIVEFANQLHREGWSRREATLQASKLRVRPILMTSFAFILGVVPLVVASGAGAEMRKSLGTAVFSGMLGVTLFGIFLTPVFFYVLQGIEESPLLARGTIQMAGAFVFGGLLGLAIGFLVGSVAEYPLDWSVVVGGCAGSLGAATFQEIHRRFRPTSPPRFVAHAGLPASSSNSMASPLTPQPPLPQRGEGEPEMHCLAPPSPLVGEGGWGGEGDGGESA